MGRPLPPPSVAHGWVDSAADASFNLASLPILKQLQTGVHLKSAFSLSTQWVCFSMSPCLSHPKQFLGQLGFFLLSVFFGPGTWYSPGEPAMSAAGEGSASRHVDMVSSFFQKRDETLGQAFLSLQVRRAWGWFCLLLGRAALVAAI